MGNDVYAPVFMDPSITICFVGSIAFILKYVLYRSTAYAYRCWISLFLSLAWLLMILKVDLLEA